jgi:uncharacterized protein YjbI with pentapeptide repeats
MANLDHLEVLRQGRETWHEWRRQNPRVAVDPRAAVDLSHADLRGMDLKGMDLSWANFRGSDLRRADLSGAFLDMATFQEANLSEADFGSKEVRTDHLVQLFAGASLFSADLRNANLSKARLEGVDLSGADLRGAILTEANLEQANLDQANGAGAKLISANLQRANLFAADLSGADLHEANLQGTYLGSAILHGVDMTRCIVGSVRGSPYLQDTAQRDLIIPVFQMAIRVDSLEIAQLVDYVLDHAEMWQVVDQFKTNIVFLLGHFEGKRRNMVTIWSNELYGRGYVPVVFEQAKDQSLPHLLANLMRIARFVIADITEIDQIVKDVALLAARHPLAPVQPFVQLSTGNYNVSEELAASPSVLEPYRYQSVEDIQRDAGALIDRVEQKRKELTGQ